MAYAPKITHVAAMALVPNVCPSTVCVRRPVVKPMAIAHPVISASITSANLSAKAIAIVRLLIPNVSEVSAYQMATASKITIARWDKNAKIINANNLMNPVKKTMIVRQIIAVSKENAP
jgi:hypothetical protein